MIRPSKLIITCFILFCLSASTLSSPSQARNYEQDEKKPQSLAAASVHSSERHTRSTDGSSYNHHLLLIKDPVILDENLPNRLKRSVSSPGKEDRHHESRTFESKQDRLKPLMLDMGKKLPFRFKRELIRRQNSLNVELLSSKSKIDRDTSPQSGSKRERRSIIENVLQNSDDLGIKLVTNKKSSRVKRSSNEEDKERNTKKRIKRSFDENRDAETQDLMMNKIADEDIEDIEDDKNFRRKRRASGITAGDGLPMTQEDSAESFNGPAAVNSDRVKRSVVAASRILRQQQMQKQKQMASDASQQVSSYTAYELSPAATKHKGSKGTSHKNSGHKAGFVASSGHKSGTGHKAGKGFEEAHQGAHEKEGASGHSGSGGKKYSGGEHKSHHHGHATSGKKGAKGQARGHKAHHSKGAHSDGYKAQKNKKESGGKKSFYDESDHKGYHSKYDHFDSFHESSNGGSEEKSSHSSLEKHDGHGEKGHHESGKQKKHQAGHSTKHAKKDAEKHHATSEKTASHEKKQSSKH